IPHRPQSHAEWRRGFQTAAELGAEILIAPVDGDAINLVAQLCREFDVRVLARQVTPVVGSATTTNPMMQSDSSVGVSLKVDVGAWETGNVAVVPGPYGRRPLALEFQTRTGSVALHRPDRLNKLLKDIQRTGGGQTYLIVRLDSVEKAALAMDAINDICLKMGNEM
ncbi:MAG: hypothetical protein N3G20_07820, partial [Verrucomicrobiae bacterium]|nr:hypothetical protein [Verrucomicrobiae bacterium]